MISPQGMTFITPSSMLQSRKEDQSNLNTKQNGAKFDNEETDDLSASLETVEVQFARKAVVEELYPRDFRME